MPAFPNVPEQLAALADIDDLLRRHAVAYWLFGGWAVDFHAGQVTREHADIDIAVWADDGPRLGVLLQDATWTHRPQTDEDGYTCYERRGVRLEVAFLARDEAGHVYTPLRDGRGDWPSNSFGSEVAQLDDVRARVMSRDAVIADKSVLRTDAEAAAKDRADVTTLIRPPQVPRTARPNDTAS